MPSRHPNGYSAYLERLRELPFVEEVEFDERVVEPDTEEDDFAEQMRRRRGEAVASTVARLRLIDGNEFRFRTTSHLPAELADFPTTANSATPSLLFMPRISAELGDKLQALGIAFMDKHGNCNLPVGKRYLARVQRPLPRTRVVAKRTAMRAPGYQVLYSLLADWSLLGKSQRDIAAAAGTSKQPVADLLQALVHDGFVRKRRRTHVWATYTASTEPGPNGELLDRWVAGYRDSLRPKLLVGRFRLPPPAAGQALDGYIEEQLEGRDFYFTGTAGGQRLVNYYRGPLTTVHLGPPDEAVRRQLRALASSSGDFIWLRHMPASEPDKRADEDDGSAGDKRILPAHTATPLLVYAELMSDPDPRARESAALIREEWLPWSL